MTVPLKRRSTGDCAILERHATRSRINAFATVVGNLQPILAQVPTFIEQAAMSADPEEEDVLMSEFDQVLSTPPLRPALEEMVAMDVEADVGRHWQANSWDSPDARRY